MSKKERKSPILKNVKVKSALLIVVISVTLYLLSSLGIIAVTEEKVDSILESVETINQELSNIREQLSKDSEEEYYEDNNETDSSIEYRDDLDDYDNEEN